MPEPPNQVYSGVNGTIAVADPWLRQPPPDFSAVQVALTFPDDSQNRPQWIEAGWSKDAGANNCDPWLYWHRAPDPNGAVVQWVAPAQIGRNYRFNIALSDATQRLWSVRIVEDWSERVVFYKGDIRLSTPFDRGNQLQSNGEVYSWISDMGISGMLNLRYRLAPGSGWAYWNATRTRADAPFWIPAIQAPYSYQVGGNQGNPNYYCR